MSMTHDESASFYYLNDQNVLGHLFNENAWPNANNHWFNTILFQFTTRLFGVGEWAIRLPNLLSFGLYSYFLIKIFSKFNVSGLMFLGFAFAICNAYLLDFFTTARGYGLALAFSTAGIYYFFLFTKEFKIRDSILGSLALCLATLSLFSYLSLYAALVLAVFAFIVISKKQNIGAYWNSLSVIVLSFIFTLVLIFIPLKTLSGNAEFKWGALSLMKSFASLFNNMGYGKWYIPNGTFIFGFILGLLVLVLIINSKKIKFNSEYFKESFYLIFIAIFIVGLVASRYIVETFYPIDRKTIMYIPLFGILIVSQLSQLEHLKKFNILGYFVGCILVIHFIFSFQTNATREWWYDANTKEFAFKIAEENEENISVTVGCHWFFYHTINHYSKSVLNNKLKLHNYNKEIDTTQIYDYFICFDSDLPLLEPYYEVMHRDISGRMILKKKVALEEF
jgi:hypothetical protein